ncbi:MFS transporter [Paenibacillus eucommiae]|uniref:MFS family permease n=1 Tax=Paenibacillus eucommiae TaxID=1355755 RepID=A0ABS4IYP8_9BACL|nr:MFS transporter [Paenibacillus eucommiae]MBP1992703.1 MFS family permease [Paenibacillus eucommiae]
MEWLHKWKDKPMLSPFVLKLLFIMFVVEFVKGALLLTILPVYMKTTLGASAFIIGWTLAAQYIGDNVLRTPVGWIIDKIGYRITMLSGVLLTFISVVIVATSSQYMGIIVACALLGLGTAPLWPCVITGTTEMAGDKPKGTSMSVVYMSWLLGVGLGPVVINFFIIGADYHIAFRLLIGCMTAVILVALFLPRRPSVTSEVKDVRRERVKGATDRFSRMMTYLREVKRSMSFSPLLFPAMFAQTFALGILTPILTLYAKDVLKLSSSEYSLFLVVGGGVTVALLIPVGRLVDRLGVHWFLTIGFALSAITLLVFTYVSSKGALFGLVAVLGAGYALIIPSWNGLIASVIPKEKRGAVWGFFLTIEGLGMIIGPIVSGKLWDVYGPHAPFIASGTVLVALLILQAFISTGKKVVVR